MQIIHNRILPFTEEEYEDWKAEFEAGYGQPRPGVSAEEVEQEIAAIPQIIRHTYMAEIYIGKGSPGIAPN